MKNSKVQFIRGMAITAVVMIHTTPPGYWQVFCKPFINFAVAAFLFLSGYLTKLDQDDWKGFYRRRIGRLLLPYIVWSVIYSIPDICSKGLTVLFKNLLTANSCSILYYVFVYVQFVLLTPLMGRLARSKYRFIGWFIAPVSVMAFKYYSLFTGFCPGKHMSLIWSDLCLGWFTFYYLGLVLGNRIIERSYPMSKFISWYAVSILLQMFEGYVWSSYDMVGCGSQLKLSSLLSSSIFMLIIHTYLEDKSRPCRCRFMCKIGDHSFGIYLSHILILKGLAFLPFYSFLPYPLNSLVLLLVSLLLSDLHCRLTSSPTATSSTRVLPKSGTHFS